MDLGFSAWKCLYCGLLQSMVELLSWKAVLFSKHIESRKESPGELMISHAAMQHDVICMKIIPRRNEQKYHKCGHY